MSVTPPANDDGRPLPSTPDKSSKRRKVIFTSTPVVTHEKNTISIPALEKTGVVTPMGESKYGRRIVVCFDSLLEMLIDNACCKKCKKKLDRSSFILQQAGIAFDISYECPDCLVQWRCSPDMRRDKKKRTTTTTLRGEPRKKIHTMEDYSINIEMVLASCQRVWGSREQAPIKFVVNLACQLTLPTDGTSWKRVFAAP
jgi:hypothetical protein